MNERIMKILAIILSVLLIVFMVFVYLGEEKKQKAYEDASLE